MAVVVYENKGADAQNVGIAEFLGKEVRQYGQLRQREANERYPEVSGSGFTEATKRQ
jgi:hypothetical protein